MIDYKKQGKANRAKGARFELKTRKRLEEHGWIVTKWQNNIDLEKGEIIPAKANPFNRFNKSGSGFPDFLAFQKLPHHGHRRYQLMFVEAKSNGTLNKLEKQKIDFLKKEGYDCWVTYNEEGKVKFKKL